MTDVTDNFNRANQIITASSNWLAPAVTSGTVATIVGNQLVGSGNIIPPYWNPTVNPFHDDQYSEATCVATASGFGCGLSLRIKPGVGTNNYTGYFAWAGRGTYYIFRFDAGAANQIANTSGVDYGEGRRARFEVTGNALTLSINGNVVLTATDSTYPSGQPGLMPYQSGDIMDDWLGGPTAPIAYVGASQGVGAAVAVPPLSAAYQIGINYPWNAYAADFGDGGFGRLADIPLFTSDIATLRSQGVRLIRWWIFGDGRYTPLFNPDGTTVGFNSNFFTDFDQLLQIASNNNVKLLLTLIDFTMFNVASFSGSVQQGGHDDIVKNSAHRLSFMDNALKPLLQHIAASPYKSSVYAYDIINEPENQIAGGYNGSDFFEGPAQFALADVQAFVQMAATYIHTYSGGGLATLGSAQPLWTPLWIGLGLDFHQAHYYDWMDFIGGPGSGLQVVTDITGDGGIHLDAPCLLGEFATKGTGETYGLNDTAVHSARWYLDTILARGYTGALPWSLYGGDSASDWASFQPVFTNWVNINSGLPPGSSIGVAHGLSAAVAVGPGTTGTAVGSASAVGMALAAGSGGATLPGGVPAVAVGRRLLGRKRHTAGARLRYTVDYSDWLETGERITGVAVVSSSATATVEAISSQPTQVRFYLDGGAVGEEMLVSLTVTDSIGQIKLDAAQFVVVPL